MLFANRIYSLFSCYKWKKNNSLESKVHILGLGLSTYNLCNFGLDLLWSSYSELGSHHIKNWSSQWYLYHSAVIWNIHRKPCTKNYSKLLMSSVKWQDTKSIHINLLHFYSQTWVGGKENNLIYNCTKEIKYLGTNLTKEVKYSKNYIIAK